MNAQNDHMEESTVAKELEIEVAIRTEDLAQLCRCSSGGVRRIDGIGLRALRAIRGGTQNARAKPLDPTHGLRDTRCTDLQMCVAARELARWGALSRRVASQS